MNLSTTLSRSWISWNQILRNRMGGWGENGGISQTFPVKYLGNGLSYNEETRAARAHCKFLQFYFRCFRRGMMESSHPQFPEIRCRANGMQSQGPPNDKFEFLTGNVEEKERKWRSRNFKFRIRADPLPLPRKVNPFLNKRLGPHFLNFV